MRLEFVPCDLCGAALDQAVPYCMIPAIPPTTDSWRLVRCSQCDLIALNPRPERDSMSEFYPDLAYHAFKPERGLKGWIKAGLLRRTTHQLGRTFAKGSHLLEVGCGTGDLLAVFRDEGYRVAGIEPNRAAAEIAHKRGLPVEVGDLESISCLPYGYDGILMKYALEHVHSPRQALTWIAEALKPGGRAVFWLPNADSWDAHWFKARWRGYDAPRHLYLFTPTTIGSYLEAVGLQLVKIGFSPVPNDFAGSAGSMSLPTLAVWFPVSAWAAARHASGRMIVEAVKGRG